MLALDDDRRIQTQGYDHGVYGGVGNHAVYSEALSMRNRWQVAISTGMGLRTHPVARRPCLLQDLPGKNYSLDPEGGLYWLDLTASRGLSFNDIINGVGNTWRAQGWRHASASEVEALFKNNLPSLIASRDPNGRYWAKHQADVNGEARGSSSSWASPSITRTGEGESDLTTRARASMPIIRPSYRQTRPAASSGPPCGAGEWIGRE